MRIHSLPCIIFTRIIASLSIMVFISFISSVHGRILRINSSDHLISDGIDHVDDQSPALTANDVMSASTCQHTYGFLPCAENAGGYIYQILVYQGQLVFAEILISSGSKDFFKILEKYFGTSKYVSIIFQIFKGLPSMMMMIISGVFGSKETAQSLVSLGVGVYAGITVFTLTLQWGICLIYGTKKSQDKPESEDSESHTSCWLRGKKKFNELKGTGVALQKDTCRLAGIMLISLIPYIIVQLVAIFSTSHIVLLIALIVSAASFLSYFIYQIVDPWMQTLSSDYLQYVIQRDQFLQYVEEGKLVDDDGNPNYALIKNVFDETDKDGDGYITGTELAELLKKVMPWISDKDIKEAYEMEAPDSGDDNKTNESKFANACVKLAQNTGFVSREFSDKDFQQFSLMEKGKLNIDQIMSKILKHSGSQQNEESLIMENGKPNSERIMKIFNQYDEDQNTKISRKELEKIISKVQFGNLKPKSEDVVNIFFHHFDIDRNNTIDKEEFVHGLERWLDEASLVAKCSDKTKSVDEFDKIVWGKNVPGYSLLDSVKCVFRIVLGIVLLTFGGGPLTTSIQQLSYAMGVPSFSISFVIVPWAMNTRILIEAIFPVSIKGEKAASLTFSEIYSRVVMNNISGLTILLAVVYAKDLPWDYSAEVLTILVVCAVIGILGISHKEIYPLWTCLLAFFLYPFSLALYCFVVLVLHWN